ncbi:RbsD or FucU transport [Paenarthrobacter sp. DKR-5]|uniref:RbsD/FucU family protein n=1 Tax=Paenarthrobacter sp. DKR-5 TaxID=2835535 RepID=UPI001BDCED1E|nr:RbsD/FucU family protein [Paenarthrobacter sp. DKR-5]MBT1003590.1 RbsD or FucU transport [Paenarthrobacter sp. DKR-5]
MINYGLTHPGLIRALAESGHGSQILIADGNYPHNTGAPASAARIALNLRPGLLTVDHILEVLIDAVPIEAAAVMAPPDGRWTEAVRGYQRALGAEVPFTSHERFDFYNAARSPDVAVVIASGDTRPYANLLLTIGVVADGTDRRGADEGS